MSTAYAMQFCRGAPTQINTLQNLRFCLFHQSVGRLSLKEPQTRLQHDAPRR